MRKPPKESSGFSCEEHVQHGQGSKDTSPALEKFETAVIERKVWHAGNLVIR